MMNITTHLDTSQEVVWKNYLQDNEIFVDFINSILF